MFRQKYTIALFVVLPAWMAACDSPEDAQPPAVVRDSAGVQIIENQAPLWSIDDTWQIETEPALIIGVKDGDAEYEFQAIADAERLADGSIVVADALAAELRVFDAAGRFVRAIGRSGEGPGEFRNLGAVWRYGDSIATWDRSLLRITIFDSMGNVGRIATLSASSGESLRPAAAGILETGALVSRSASVVTPALGEGVHRAAGEVTLYSAAGQRERALTPLAGEEWVGITTNDAGLLLTPRPFRRDGYVAIRDDRIYAGDSDRFDIALYSGTGVLRQRIRMAGANAPLTAEDVQVHIDATLAAQSEEERKRLLRTSLEQTPFPDSYPAFAALVPDDDGHLWVAESPRAGSAERHWLVFDSSGRWLGRVIAPARTRVLRASAGRLLARHVDELGVQTIRDYRIVKRAETPAP